MLFNFLKIDTKDKIIYFDDLKLTSELPIEGKFYAPNLKGIECHMSEQVKSLKHQTNVSYFDFTIGANENDQKTIVCLIYGKPAKNGQVSQPQYLIMTIL